ncbi:hypothetical protein [Reinekea thalattae]|uniref:Uncharacterized protein n=1 Tax=Reinekea thalattae TaxID=2593301 RepID=A0A5C8Z480_9GAMM|nr:hypothetical protein [Reinekea thalattae]TXR52059.1 hypothetical protein FME95_11630 [Reinekea thalattae]
MNTAENLEQFGNVQVLDAMQADAANDSDAAADAYDELNQREKNGGGPLPFDPVIAELSTKFSGIGFGIAANKRGPHWALNDDDSRQLGVAIAQVIYKYMPDMENLGPVGNLTVVSAMIVGPRFMLDAMQAKEQKKEQEEKQSESAH